MLTYLASCGSETCDKFNSSSAKWFKVSSLICGSPDLH